LAFAAPEQAIRALRRAGVRAYLHADDELATWVAHGLIDLRRRGLALPSEVRIDAALFADDSPLAMEYVQAGDALYVNPSAALFAEGATGIAEALRSLHRDQHWTSTDHALHPLIHELGHRAHLLRYPNALIFLQAWDAAAAALLPSIRDHVGDYATGNPLEFVAEVYTGLVTGRTYPATIMGLFDRLEGVRP
jgi:hypothetical protein